MGEKSAAEKALDAAIKEAARLKQECLCAAQSAHNVLSAAIAAIAADQKAGWAKAAHLKCALAGTPANACAVSPTPVVSAKALVADAKNAQCGAGEPDKCKGQVVPATKGDNGVWFTWACPCSGGCSKATPQCGWGICSKEDWKGLPSAQMKKDKPCSSKIFDNKWGHCDPSNNLVQHEDGGYNELVFCYHLAGAPGGKKMVYGVNSGDSLFSKDGDLAWIHNPAGLKQVDAVGDMVWGVNSADSIFWKTGVNGAWTHVAGALKDVATSGSSKDSTLWGVNSANQIFYRKGVNGAWVHVAGALKQIDAMGDMVWGVNSGDSIYWRTGPNGSWNHVAGGLKYISVCGSSTSSTVWGVNSGDDIYYRKGVNGAWVHVAGKLKTVSCGSDGAVIWGTNSNDDIFSRAGENGAWVHVAGKLKQISVAS